MTNYPKTTEGSRRNRGSAFILVIVITLAVTMVCSIVMGALFSQYKMVRRDFNEDQAMYMAEAGIYKTIWYLSGHEGRDQRWRPNNQAVSIFDKSSSLS